jgi:xylulokinase
MPCFLGADLGTTNLKAVLVDEAETILGSASRALRIEHPRAGWSEQDPQNWWRAFLSVCAELRSSAPGPWRAIAAIGLTGQMHAALCLDRRGRPLRPAILWNDGRAQAECGELVRAVPGLRKIAGVPPMAGFTAPKLLWLRRHEPETMRALAHILLPKDYIRLRLSGEHVTDMSDAAGTLLLDECTRRWSQPLVEAAGIAPKVLPRLAEGSDAVAVLRSGMAKRLGLSEGVILAGGAGDAAAGAAGIGAIEASDGFISLGTSGQYFTADDEFRLTAEPTIHCFAHCLPHRWYRMAALLNGADGLTWIGRLLRIDAATALARLKPGGRPSSLLFLPYLAGERTPHADPDLRAAVLGLSHAAGPEELIRSVLEGVALSFADVEERLERDASSPCPLPLIGGAARSAVWMQIFADALNRSIVLYRGSDHASPLGAARLARLAVTGEKPETVCRKPQIVQSFSPRPAWHEAYRRRLEVFRRALAVAKLGSRSFSSHDRI